RGQSHELGEPANDQRLQGPHHDAEAGVRGSSEHTGAETNAHAERRCYGVAGVGIAGIDVDGSGFRRVGDLCEAGLRVGRFKQPKSKASKAPVPLHPLLAGFMLAWRERTHYPRDNDYVFPSVKLGGKKPLSASIMVQKYLRPAAIKAGVIAADWKGRFGFHNFRHSLATALVKLKVDPKTVQG